MNLHQLPKTVLRPKKRVGRGIGSGKGKTSGRGMKGQKARGKVPQGFIGGTLPLYKKLPYRRGHHRGIFHKSWYIPSGYVVINIAKLSIFKSNSTIGVEQLVEQKLINVTEAKKRGVKIVGAYDLPVALTIALPVSKTAALSIEKAGGKVVNG